MQQAVNESRSCRGQPSYYRQTVMIFWVVAEGLAKIQDRRVSKAYRSSTGEANYFFSVGPRTMRKPMVPAAKSIDADSRDIASHAAAEAA